VTWEPEAIEHMRPRRAEPRTRFIAPEWATQAATEPRSIIAIASERSIKVLSAGEANSSDKRRYEEAQ
jgi:hypothetical protein